jgi:hypothetical protein
VHTTLANRRPMPLMRSSVLWACALALPLACSATSRDQPAAAGASGSGSGGGTVQVGDERAFVPESLANTPLEGQVVDGLTLIAFTLRQGASGLALYGAVRNDRQTPACEAGMTTYFVDQAGQVVTTATTVLESAHFYRLDTGVVIRCVAPGEIAMTGAAALPKEITLGELGSLQHAFPAFTVDSIVPVEALTVSDVQAVTTGVGTLYTGTLRNRLDVGAASPRVTIFPVNRVGRPLAMATTGAASELPAGSNRSFETGNVDAAGVGFAAYPSATFVH